MAMRHNFKTLAIIGLALTAASPVLAQPAPTVVIAEAKTTEISNIIEALGTANADEAVTITSTVAEKITDIHFTDGQIVEKGDILVTLEQVEEQAALTSAKATFEEAQVAFNRVRNLKKQDFASAAQYDERRAALDVARANVSVAEARLALHTIRAPFAGALGLRMISPGTLITPGTAITTLDKTNPIKLDFTVPSLALSALKQGGTLTVRADDYPKETFAGKIATINPRIDPVSRSVAVRALINNDDNRIKPGMLLHVRINYAPRTAIMIPEGALVPNGTQHFIFVATPAEDNHFTTERREVKIGLRKNGQVEITEGLTAGDRIIVDGTLKVRNGAKVLSAS